MLKIYSLSSYFLGFFSIICIPKFIIGGVTLYIGDIFYLLIFFLSLTVIKQKVTTISYNTYTISIILLLLLFSTLNFTSPLIVRTSLLVSGDIFDSLKYVIKTIPNIVFFILLLYSPNIYQCTFCMKFINGFILAVIFHSIYSTIQIIYLYLFQIDIHTLIFDFLKVTDIDLAGHDIINFAYPPIIRTTGFHWDPAYFGLWGGIVLFSIFFFKNKYTSKIAFIIIFTTWIQTFSKTAYIGGIILLFIFIFLHKYLFHPIKKKNIFFKSTIALTIITILILTCVPHETLEDINYAIHERIDKDNNSMIRHTNYPKYSLLAVLNDPFHFLFGYGARNSSRGLYHVMDGYDNELEIRSSFEIESDFCKTLVNFGFFSLSMYIIFITTISYFLFLLIKKGRSPYVIFCFSSIVLSFICGISYSYNDAKWIWIVYFISILIINNKNKFTD